MSGGLSLYRLLHGRWSRSPSLLPPGWGQSKNANKSCPPSWGLSKNTQKSFGLSSGTLLKSNSTNLWDFRFQVPPVCTDLCRGEYTVQTDRCQLEMITFYHQNIFHTYFSSQKIHCFRSQPENHVLLRRPHSTHIGLHRWRHRNPSQVTFKLKKNLDILTLLL